MEKITLKEISYALGAEAVGNADITDICIDTRKITEGCLFICIRGARFDAHSFAAEAKEKGASALMVDHQLAVDIPQVIVEDTSAAMLALSNYYRRKFVLPVVGLTGSVGKTTTKEFIALVLGAKYKTLKTQGNLNNEIGVPQMLFRLDYQIEAAVIEMGMNHFGEIDRLSKAVEPTLALITNIGVSHIENLGSREGILKAKTEILAGMKHGCPLILNGDDDMLQTVDLGDAYPIITYAVRNTEKADFTAENILEKDGKTTFTVLFDNGNSRQEITIPTIGIHNVYNALAAFAVGCELDVDCQAAADALAAYVPEGMRQKSVSFNGITCIEDCYNASPDSMKASLTALADTAGNRKIAVLADMLELGDYAKQAHMSVGEMVVHNKIDYLFTYGEMAAYIVKAAKDRGMKNAFHFESKDELCEKLIPLIEKGDTIVFKASRGMRLEDVINKVYEVKKND